MRKLPLFLAGVLVGCGSVASVQAAPRQASSAKQKPPIDIVFAIDCSGSMGGVIETAKQKIWDIVNEAGKAKPTPQLRIGLIAYGNASNSYRVYDLSGDLDTVYEHLSSFRDEGWSQEYVGEAIQKAVADMSWSSQQLQVPSLRSLYVVGNETAQQGPIDFRLAAPRAKEKGIFVNAIYCGSSGGQDTWKQFSSLGGGKYLEIAANGGSVMVPTPFDKKIEELNVKLNATYVPYGKMGEAASANQKAQDSNAMRYGGGYSNASRAMAKASSQYQNAQWDLVDKSKQPGFDLAKIPNEELPAEMRSMMLDKKKAFLAKKQKERAAIQKELMEVGNKRAEFLKKENKKSGRKD
ncbi:VWA domain-containing protein, partial [bacterium]